MKISTNVRFAFLSLFILVVTNRVFAESRKVIISEFMAINNSTLQDEDGNYSDWLELYNPGETGIDLNGWYLTDKSDNLTKWEIPAITLNADSYLVIFASEKDRTDPSKTLHTNFKLSGSGEFLALVEADGTTISYSFGEQFPAQREDISYGTYQQQLIYFDQPTPGQENQLGNQVVAPLFSKERGFYSEPFSVTLSVPGNNLQIYYTTDGTRPSKEKGTLYTGPIQIQTTTPLSAVAVNEENVNSEVISNTYFFIDAIVNQPNNPSGYPSEWSPLKYRTGNAPADYEMDPEVVNNPEYKDLMDDALLAIPTLSIVTDIGNLFSHSTDPETGGIYIYTGKSGAKPEVLGLDWERPVSLEYFDPSTQKSFQLNCGLRLHGGNSRLPDNSQKHSFRVSFRSRYGPSKLNFNFFDEKRATNEFNSLVLRAGYNYSWMKNNPDQRAHATYLQDPFTKTTQLDMGYTAAHEKFVHLYLNGLYWGVYNVSEKLTNDFIESYWGGDEEDYDVVKDHSDVIDGDRKAWDRMFSQVNAGLGSAAAYQKIQGNNPDGTSNAGYENLLDVENLIDYLLLNFFIGNGDWDGNNWIAARNRVTNEAGFRFFCWDAETSMFDLNKNIVGMNESGNPTNIYTQLQSNKEFKRLFADHIQRHFFNDGLLSPDANIDRLTQLANEIDLAIIAESARWGDYRRDVDPVDNPRKLYTRNDDWLVEVNHLVNNYLPYRSDIVVQQFRDAGLFPDVDAPVLSHFGGEFDQPIELGMSSTAGEIYYTYDNSDPREAITGSISSQATLYQSAVHLESNGTIKARTKFGSEWSALTEAEFEFDHSTTALDQPVLASANHGSYPNPFSRFTTLYYTLLEESAIQVSIMGMDGRIVEKLFCGHQSPGEHEVSWYPEDELTGIYIYRIRINEQCYYGKLIRN